MYSPELESKIIEWRAKCQNGTMTQEEYIEVIRQLRGERLTAMTQPKEKKTAGRGKKKAVAETPASPDDLMKQLNGE